MQISTASTFDSLALKLSYPILSLVKFGDEKQNTCKHSPLLVDLFLGLSQMCRLYFLVTRRVYLAILICGIVE